LPILIQILTVLPKPLDNILKDIQKTFYKFLWRDKVTGEILTNSYEDGGLKMIDITLFCQALKMTWIKKYIDPLKSFFYISFNILTGGFGRTVRIWIIIGNASDLVTVIFPINVKYFMCKISC
jgi:hypothetical protein